MVLTVIENNDCDDVRDSGRDFGRFLIILLFILVVFVIMVINLPSWFIISWLQQ